MTKKAENKYRTREERIQNALDKKRGACLELFRPISDVCHADIGGCLSYEPAGIEALRTMTVGDLMDKLDIRELYFKAATSAEGMRDIKDVEAVMTEKNIVGTVIPARVMEPVTRAMQKTFGFVRPKNEPGQTGEE